MYMHTYIGRRGGGPGRGAPEEGVHLARGHRTTIVRLIVITTTIITIIYIYIIIHICIYVCICIYIYM